MCKTNIMLSNWLSFWNIEKQVNGKTIAVGTIPRSNRKIVGTYNVCKIQSPNTHINDCPFSCLETDTSIKSGGVVTQLRYNYNCVN